MMVAIAGIPLMNAFDLHPLTNHSDSLSIGAMAIDSIRPDRIYVGSGEGQGTGAYFGIGPGSFRRWRP